MRGDGCPYRHDRLQERDERKDRGRAVDVSPEKFDKGWLGRCDTVVITNPDMIHRIVKGLIMGAKRNKYRNIDTRGKLILQHHDGFEMVVYYNNLYMVIDDTYYYANIEITQWLDELRENSHNNTIH